MAIARLFLPLLILAGLALFALQNWSPVLPIVVAGLNTQALPLALWMLTAIAAGATTTIAVSSLFSLSRFTAVRRSNKQRPSASPSRPETESRPWVAAWTKRNEARANPPSTAKTRIQDDWENRQTREEWDDWEEDSPAPASSASFSSAGVPPDVHDRSDEDWDNWEGYTEADRVSGTPRPPVRTDFEVRQAPVAQKQSGSLYSVSYERAETDPQRPNEVYDADYRVIVPPLSSEPAPAISPEDEDWGFDDDDIPQEPRDSRGGGKADRPRNT
ncbi:MAG: hypothetical protein KME11_04080 [Timaviella obliquedivisa GSE-PSE-MK23-08B]|nr:hypothetical protein [Timaviella obliquedivisa GSE-PSE-MK23-08B]